MKVVIVLINLRTNCLHLYHDLQIISNFTFTHKQYMKWSDHRRPRLSNFSYVEWSAVNRIPLYQLSHSWSWLWKSIIALCNHCFMTFIKELNHLACNEGYILIQCQGTTKNYKYTSVSMISLPTESCHYHDGSLTLFVPSRSNKIIYWVDKLFQVGSYPI